MVRTRPLILCCCFDSPLCGFSVFFLVKTQNMLASTLSLVQVFIQLVGNGHCPSPLLGVRQYARHFMKINLKAFFEYRKDFIKKLLTNSSQIWRDKWPDFEIRFQWQRKFLSVSFALDQHRSCVSLLNFLGSGFWQLLEFSISSRRLLLNILGTNPVSTRTFFIRLN